MLLMKCSSCRSPATLLKTVRMAKLGFAHSRYCFTAFIIAYWTVHHPIVCYPIGHSAVESRKVVPIPFWQSLVKSCRSNCEHTQAAAKLPTKREGPIDTPARLAGPQAPPLTRLS